MAYKKLTQTGEEFIRGVSSRLTSSQGATSMIRGKNSYNLPFSDKKGEAITWVCSITNTNGGLIVNNTEFGEYLIDKYNTWAEVYAIDANVMAAQAFQESSFKAWNYAKTSTASGINQFIMLTVYDVIYNRKFLNSGDIAKLTLGMSLPDRNTSWIGVAKKGTYSNVDRTRQYSNRSILHQNICNNPDIMIKAQCAFMDWISNRNNDLACNSLFAYNRGSGLRGNNYVQIVNYTAKEYGNAYIKEGLDYVNKIFGYLGDQNNIHVPQGNITKGLWFGYNIDYNNDNFNANLG